MSLIEYRVDEAVAIITLNEERNLAECLASVAFADEIVVVDGGSRDRSAADGRQQFFDVLDDQVSTRSSR